MLLKYCNNSGKIIEVDADEVPEGWTLKEVTIYHASHGKWEEHQIYLLRPIEERLLVAPPAGFALKEEVPLKLLND